MLFVYVGIMRLSVIVARLYLYWFQCVVCLTLTCWLWVGVYPLDGAMWVGLGILLYGKTFGVYYLNIWP